MSEVNTYKKITDVELVSALNDAVNVLINDNGALKQLPVADVFATNEQINELSEEIADLKENGGGSSDERLDKIATLFAFTAGQAASNNRLNPDEIVQGQYITNNGVMGENASYITSGFIPVTPGEKMTFQFTTDGGWREKLAFRWVAAYAADKTLISNAGAEYAEPYIVPDGVAYIRFAVAIGGYTGSTEYACVPFANVVPFEPYGVMESEETVELKPSAYIKIKNGYTVEVGTDWTAEVENHDLCGYTMSYRADIPNGLTALEFGKGKGIWLGGYIKVDATNVSVYFGENAETTYVYPHSLTFADYICVQLAVGYDAKAKITVTTNGGTYTNDSLLWSGVRRGAFFAKCAEATNAKFAYSANCWNTDTHIYGDSYLSANGDNRWTHYLLQDGATNVLLNAYSGRKSAEALSIFKDVMLYCKRPERIVWCLGMNDGDNGAVNASWQSCVEELMTICEDNAIELILATIPNVATVDNAYKNAYIRDSGYRYIDFATAVGASADAEWYSNMLSGDGVHPDVQGAIALYTQAIVDVPELLA